MLSDSKCSEFASSFFEKINNIRKGGQHILEFHRGQIDQTTAGKSSYYV